MPGYENLDQILLKEIVQKKEEGCDFDSEKFIEKIKKSKNNNKKLTKIYSDLNKIKVAKNFKYIEPNSLKNIKKESAKKRITINSKINYKEIYDKVYGAWLGRSIGCVLGKPLETSDFMFGPNQKENVKKYLKGANSYPLNYYVPGESEVPNLNVQETKSTKEKIEYVESDDDIRYTLLNFEVISNNGLDFKTSDVAKVWLNKLPFNQLYTAELQSFLNLINTKGTPRRGVFDKVDWDYNATYLNPYREWIGAQIRADLFGYIVPGNPGKASDLAWKDARMTHVKNGIYGEMFFAAIISASFAENNVRKLLEIGLNYIPQKSRLAEAIKYTLQISKKYDNWEECFENMIEKYGHYSPVHTINNALIVVIALLYGNGNFEKSITIAVMCGYDTDCNGATTGSIIGILNGEKMISEKWKSPINNLIKSEVIGFGDIKISDIAFKTTKLIEKYNQ